jgi:hypothetical protein
MTNEQARYLLPSFMIKSQQIKENELNMKQTKQKVLGILVIFVRHITSCSVYDTTRA